MSTPRAEAHGNLLDLVDAALTAGLVVPCRELDSAAWIDEGRDTLAVAARACVPCSVRDECLSYALEHPEETGVWGGLLPRERSDELARRRRVAARDHTPTQSTPRRAVK